MAIDNTLLWVLVATAGLSLLSLVYVWVDEALKRRRYERQKQEEAVPSTAAASEPEAGIPLLPQSQKPSLALLLRR